MLTEEMLETVILMMLAGTATSNEYERLLTPQGEGLRLRTLQKGRIFAHSGLPCSKVFLLLNGSCRALNYSHEGKRVFAGTISHPQIFGLYELMNDIPEHTATLECVTACLVLEADVNKTLTCLKTRPKAAFGAMRFLAMFTDDLLSRSNRLTMNSKRESLLLYFYAASSGKQLPVCLSIKKDELAEQLNLNLRTLYRQLDELEAEGFLYRIHGKIEIDAVCRARMLEEVGYLVEQ